MDIHKWLAETVQPKDPSKLVENPSTKPSRRPVKPASVTKERLQQKQTKSDSSLLDLGLQLEEKRANKRGRPVVETSDDSAESDAFDATRSELPKSNLSSQRYARQPRRKTRPERYQPLSKTAQERGKHAHQIRQGESKTSRRKSKRRKGEKPGSGIVQSFHAKNVSGDRLTLKPQEQLGIFNKGKTSRAVKGRGLPDLVFSEMKFLQKTNDQPGSALQPEKSRKKHTHDRAQAKEGEISAFFTTTCPVLTQKVGNAPATKLHESPGASRHIGERSSAIDAAIPTVEMPDEVSFLGFGSRGSRRETSSYVSWSDSNQAASTMQSQLRMKRGAYTSQFDPVSCKGDKTAADQEEASPKRAAPHSRTMQRSYRTDERFRVSSLAQTHRRLSRSYSYPPQTSSPRRVNLLDCTAELQTKESISSSSSMPPLVSVGAGVDVAPVRNRKSLRSDRNKLSYHRHSMSSDEENNTDIDQHTSSDLGRVVEECKNTFSERRRAAPRERHTVSIDPAYCTIESERQGFTSSYPIIQQIPTVRFVGEETRGQPTANFASPNIYEHQLQREQLPLRLVAEENNFLGPYPSQEDFLDDEDEIGHGDLGCDDLTDEAISYSLGKESRSYRVEGRFIANGTQQLVPEGHVVAPGFWRPNRLY